MIAEAAFLLAPLCPAGRLAHKAEPGIFRLRNLMP